MADSTTIPQDQIRIFDRSGVNLAQFRATVSRSWVIGDAGRAEFTYANRKTNIVNETVLQFGNWLLIENSILPPWIGVIDTPRSWSPREVTVSAYGPERVLEQRRGPLEWVLTGSSGTIFTKTLMLLNQAEQTVIREGDIWRGGTQQEETITPEPLRNVLRRIYENSGEEYNWRPSVDSNGRLIVFADWTDKLGIDADIHLQEGGGGGNIEKAGGVLVEDGPIYNDLLAYGNGATWRTKQTAIVTNAESGGRYGLRQTSKEYSEVASVEGLRSKGQEFIAANKQPQRAFTLSALNVGNTWQYMNLGNRVNVLFQNMGFYSGGQGYQTRVRIVGMSYNPAMRNKLTLVVEEVL